MQSWEEKKKGSLINIYMISFSGNLKKAVQRDGRSLLFAYHRSPTTKERGKKLGSAGESLFRDNHESNRIKVAFGVQRTYSEAKKKRKKLGTGFCSIEPSIDAWSGGGGKEVFGEKSNAGEADSEERR